MKKTETSNKARSKTAYRKHLRKPGKRAANKGTRKLMKLLDTVAGSYESGDIQNPMGGCKYGQ